MSKKTHNNNKFKTGKKQHCLCRSLILFDWLNMCCHPHHWPLDAATTNEWIRPEFAFSDDKSLQHLTQKDFYVHEVKYCECSSHFDLGAVEHRQQDKFRSPEVFLGSGACASLWVDLPSVSILVWTFSVLPLCSFHSSVMLPIV